MAPEALLLSVRPSFVSRILNGTKTLELRRVRPHVHPGQDVLIYSSSPAMALVALAVVQDVEVDAPADLWLRVAAEAGVTPDEYTRYFAGAKQATAIRLAHVTALEPSLGLQEMRERWPWFRPPQSFRYVRATVGAARTSVSRLAPRC